MARKLEAPAGLATGAGQEISLRVAITDFLAHARTETQSTWIPIGVAAARVFAKAVQP